MLDLRTCPNPDCKIPLMRTACSDLDAHHGQCPTCDYRVSSSTLGEWLELLGRLLGVSAEESPAAEPSKLDASTVIGLDSVEVVWR